MELHDLFTKWKLNHNLFSSRMNMPKGTFNNKLNSKHESRFNLEEISKIKCLLKELIHDTDQYIKRYEIDDSEDFNGVDSDPTGKYFS